MAESTAPADDPSPVSSDAAHAEESAVPEWWDGVREVFLTFDRRTLGLTRILLGFFLLFDLFRRTPDWFRMFSNDGVLPSHYNLWRPQSNGFTVLNAFSTEGELAALWVFCFCVFACIFIGYKTRVAQVIAVVLIASLNGRILLIENGGYVVNNLLLLWTSFLPLGDRFSVDALIDSWRKKPEANADDLNDRDQDTSAWRLTPHASLMGIVLLLQLGAIYFFNVKHKTGPGWANGTAAHYVMYVDRMANPPVAAVRDLIPFPLLLFMGKVTMFLEAGLPVLLLNPFGRVWNKRLAIVFIITLHLAFATTFVLGPFAWSLCVFAVLLLSREDWEVTIRTLRRDHRARTVLYDPTSAAAFWLCRVLKRFDRLELLDFEPREGLGGFAIADGDRPLRKRAAWRAVALALPVGPVLQIPFVIPGLGDLLAALIEWWPRFLGHGSTGRVEPEARAAQPDDLFDGSEPMDDHGIWKWLDDHLRARWGWKQLRGGAFLLLLGVAAFFYGSPTLKRFKLKPKHVLFGSGESAFTADDAFFWGGLAFLIVAALMLLEPWIKFVATVPSTFRVKRRRVLAGLREFIIILFWWGAVNQAVVELWVFKGAKIPQPEFPRSLSHKLRYLQGWFMFSPNPVMDDGTIVVDAVTVDGRRVDPFSREAMGFETLQPPNFDLLHAPSFGYNQIWSDYYNRMHMPANTRFRKPMKDYIFKLHERTGDPNDAIVKGTVYWVHDQNPRWGKRKSYGYGRKKLFSFTNPDREVQKKFRTLAKGKEPPEIKVPWGPTED